jgi:hypothetical protein
MKKLTKMSTDKNKRRLLIGLAAIPIVGVFKVFQNDLEHIVNFADDDFIVIDGWVMKSSDLLSKDD